jgi:hypothetical protein
MAQKPKRKRAAKKGATRAAEQLAAVPSSEVVLKLNGQQCQVVGQLLQQLDGAMMLGRMGTAVAFIILALAPYSDGVAEVLGEKMDEYGGDEEGIGPEAERYGEFLADEGVKAALAAVHDVTIPEPIRRADCELVPAPLATWRLLVQLGLVVA